MKQLNSTAYTVESDKLIVDGKHPIDVNVVSIAVNQGTVKRGTVLSITNTNEYIVLGTALVNPQTSAKANCVVAEDVDTTGASGTVAVEVYLSGHFNKNVLLAKDGYSIAAADIEDLRTSGIFVSSAN